MGINPWVSRDDSKSTQVLVLVDNINLKSDERMLVNVMFQSIGLDASQVSIKQFSEDLLQDKQQGVVSIILGDIVVEHARHDLMVLPHPATLLMYPLEKRKAYEVLGCLVLRLGMN